MKNKTGRVSDLISLEEVDKWKTNDVVTIKAGTGVGKSYFVKNRLYTKAKSNNKKILMLIHRKDCVTQFKQEIKRDLKCATIDIWTYQKVEYSYIKGNHIDFSQYAYIVCDEFHYFMSDALFNNTTDISLDVILEQTHSIKVFMSATGDYMKDYLTRVKNLNTIDYELPIDFDFIGELTFYLDDRTVERFLDEILKGDEKAIVFMSDLERLYGLYLKYKSDSIFNCSSNNPKYAKYVDDDKINNLLTNEGFNERILFTTTAMDAGVNITDKKVKHIIMEVEDEGVMIQCLGRRRVDRANKEDQLFVYIKNLTNTFLGGRITQTNDKLKRANHFKHKGEDSYLMEYSRDPDKHGIVYDTIFSQNGERKKLNDLMFFKAQIDLINMQSMIKHGYMRYISSLFNKEYFIEEREEEMKNLEEYLESIVGTRQYGKESKNTLAEMVNLRDGGNNRLIKSFKTIAPYVKELYNSKYILNNDTDWARKDSEGRKNEHYGKTYWVVLKEG